MTRESGDKRRGVVGVVIGCDGQLDKNMFGGSRVSLVLCRSASISANLRRNYLFVHPK